MPTTRHAILLTTLLITVSLISRVKHAYAQELVSIHARADNSTELASSAKTASTSTFLTALWVNAAIFGAEILAFSILRPKFSEVYEPRAKIKEHKKKSFLTKKSPWKTYPPLNFDWPLTIFKASLDEVKQQNGVDAYMFMRFLRMMLWILGPVWVISWAVLMPVDSVNSGSNNTGLSQFTFGNVGAQKQDRYWAHLACAWVFTIWIFFMIYRELRAFMRTRQEFLLDEDHCTSAQANTVLITGIPADYRNVPRLTKIFSHLPGGVNKVWLNRDMKELPDIHKRRMKACNMLEKAETKLVKKAIDIKLKEEGGRNDGKQKRRKEREDATSRYSDGERGVSRAESIVPRKDRPSHRLPLGFLPFAIPLLSKKVDTIEWCRAEIEETTQLLKQGRRVIDSEVGMDVEIASRGIAGIIEMGLDQLDSESSYDESEDEGSRRRERRHASRARGREGRERGKSRSDKNERTYPVLSSAFILFNKQIAAHLAVQALVHHDPFSMSRKYIEVAPADVIWSNIGLESSTIRTRELLGYAITAALIVCWSVPVAFIGVVSNVSSLCQTYSWLSWLCDLPSIVTGLIQGVLPALLLAALMAFLPIFLRMIARFEGKPRQTSVELSIMTRYFIFQVIHSFLIVTLSSGLIAAVPDLVQNPTSVPALLARSLPQASTFFLTYIILQGLSGSGKGYLQPNYLAIYYLKRFFAGGTPRSVYNVEYGMQKIKWGTEFPSTTLIAVIGIAYMIISPIINGLAFGSFFLFYQMYKYRFLYQIKQPQAYDTGGLFFPRALQHVFVGMYIQQICLCTLFFLARDENDKPSAIPQAILIIVLLVITVLCHSALNTAYNALMRALPLSYAIQEERQKRRRGSSKRGSKRLRAGRYDPERENKRPTEFYNPALAEPIRPIWIPRVDPALRLDLNIAEAEVQANKRAHIPSGSKNAFINEKGEIMVGDPPPGGPWMDGDYDD